VSLPALNCASLYRCTKTLEAQLLLIKYFALSLPISIPYFFMAESDLVIFDAPLLGIEGRQ
jgi:hypothetical protein